jgi:CDGSH-type Zn-finger protein
LPAVVAGDKHEVGSRELTTPEPVATITPYRDGPLIVRGPVRLQDMHGREILVERETIALCRCGKSRIRPFCDGTHKVTRFQAPSGREGDRDAASLAGSSRSD